MLKTTHRYEQTAARLVVEGFPDLSAGQEERRSASSPVGGFS